MSEDKTELPPWDLNEYLRMKYICEDCDRPPSELIEDAKEGTLICGDCGRVLEDRLIDNREEWRTFSGEGEGSKPDPSRVGKGFNPFLKGEQLSTKIAVSDGSNKKAVTELARTQQKSTVEAINTKLDMAFEKIDAYCGNFQIPQIVSNAAKQVVSDAKMAGLGGSMDAAWCLACIYVGSKRTGHQVDKRRITEMGGGIKMKVWTKHVFELNRFGVQESQQKITKLVEEGKTEEHAKAIVGQQTSISGRITPRSVLPAHCQKVGIPVWTETIAAGICDAIDDILVLGGRGATNIATTAIYIATHVVGNPRMFDEIYPLSGLQKSVSPFTL
jgi:transcription initiation factor TFIIB